MLLTLLLATRIAVSAPGTTPQTQPWVSADAQQAVAVWVEGGQILLSRIAFDGRLLDTSRIVSPRGITPRSASNGTNHLIVWIDHNDVNGRFLSPTGEFIGDSFGITDGGPAEMVAVTAAGSKYFVAWSGTSPGAALVGAMQSVERFDVFSPTDHVIGDISATAIDENNAVIAYTNQGATEKMIMTLPVQDRMAGTTNTIAAQPPPIDLRTPRIVHGDFGFAIAWTQESGPSFAFVNRLDANGKPNGDPIMVGSTSSFPPATAAPVDARVISVNDSGLFETKIDFTCSCTTQQQTLDTPVTKIAASFSNIAAAKLAQGGIAVVYEFATREEGEPLNNARPRIFLQFVDLPPTPLSRHRSARH